MRHRIHSLLMTGLLIGCAQGDSIKPEKSRPHTQIYVAAGPITQGVPVDVWDPEEPGSEELPAGSCTVEEAEPNGNETQFNDLAVGELFCGVFESADDVDVVRLPKVEPGWIRVQILAQSLFSHAHPRLFVYTIDDEYFGRFESPDWGEDIDVPIWVDETRDLYIMLQNEDTTYGEDAYWRIQVDRADAPTSWTHVEPDDHSTRATAAPIEASSTTFGQVEERQLSDWYVIDVEEVPAELQIDLEAHAFGSPLYTELVVEGPSGDQLAYANGDASMSVTVLEPGEVQIAVGACCEELQRFAGVPYWYVLSVY